MYLPRYNWISNKEYTLNIAQSYRHIMWIYKLIMFQFIQYFFFLEIKNSLKFKNNLEFIEHMVSIYISLGKIIKLFISRFKTWV